MPRSRPFLWLVLISSLISVLAASLLPITLDEAYYTIWGQRLAFGYFDHPPGVAFLAAASRIFPLQFLGPRMGTVLVGIASLLLASRLFRLSGLAAWPALFIAIALFKFNVGSLSSGVLATPDALLIFFWILALHESFFALNGHNYRWLSAGLATGLGLLAKYAMVLIGPVFLIALLKDPRGGLRKPWPYLGGILAFLIFLPNLYWNANNNWPSVSFQLRRLSHSEVLSPTELPNPVLYLTKGPEWDLASKVADRASLIDTIPAAKKSERNSIHAAFIRLLEFTGGLLVLWGFLLIPIGSLARRRPKHNHLSTIAQPARNLLLSALWVPMVFFALISLFTKVEANWPAIYMIAAAPLLAPYLLEKRKSIVIASVLNTIAIILLTLHGAYPFLPLRKDRILKESYGFPQLAMHIATLPDPVFTDKYQLVSMMRFYLPEKQIYQWPGINRPSEFTSNTQYAFSYSELKAKKEFWLLSTELIPPHYKDFKALTMERIRDCKSDGKLSIRSSENPPALTPPCAAPHEWSLIHYALR